MLADARRCMLPPSSAGSAGRISVFRVRRLLRYWHRSVAAPPSARLAAQLGASLSSFSMLIPTLSLQLWSFSGTAGTLQATCMDMIFFSSPLYLRSA